MFHFVYIMCSVSCPPNEIHILLWGVYPASPAEYLESVPSTKAAENLPGRKSCSMQLGLALLTEAILMFYWFSWFFFSCSSLHIHTLALPSLWGTGCPHPCQGLCASASGLARRRVHNTSCNDDSWFLILTRTSSFTEWSMVFAYATKGF